MTLDELVDGSLVGRSDDFVEDIAFSVEEDEGGQIFDVIFLCDGRVLIGVDLADDEFAFVFGSDFVEGRGDALAVRAPGGPEIEDGVFVFVLTLSLYRAQFKCQ